MIRDAVREAERLRLWKNADGPLGRATAGLAVEWAGQVGHPSSYGLLGGCASDVTRLEVPNAGAYGASLARGMDDVEFGLPEEYKAAISEALRSPVVLGVAAHGRIGSSPRIFGRLAELICALTAAALPATDAELWRLWDSLARSS